MAHLIRSISRTTFFSISLLSQSSFGKHADGSAGDADSAIEDDDGGILSQSMLRICYICEKVTFGVTIFLLLHLHDDSTTRAQLLTTITSDTSLVVEGRAFLPDYNGSRRAGTHTDAT
jgi:hypothetical protein